MRVREMGYGFSRITFQKMDVVKVKYNVLNFFFFLFDQIYNVNFKVGTWEVLP